MVEYSKSNKTQEYQMAKVIGKIVSLVGTVTITDINGITRGRSTR